MPLGEELLELVDRVAAHIRKAREVGDRNVRLLTLDDADQLTELAAFITDSAEAQYPAQNAYTHASMGSSLREVAEAIRSVLSRRHP